MHNYSSQVVRAFGAETSSSEDYYGVPPIEAATVTRVPQAILFCQAPYAEFIRYMDAQNYKSLSKLSRREFVKLHILITRLSQGADMETQYAKIQKEVYGRQEEAFVEAVLKRGYVVLDDDQGLVVLRDYMSHVELIRVCRTFVGTACQHYINDLLDRIAV